MTYQKLKWQAKGIRSAFWGYFAFPVLLLDFSFRWKSELKFLQVSHISSTILTSLHILLLGQNMLICFWMEITSSLAVLLGLRFSIYKKRESLFTYMPFTTYLFHTVSFSCILKDTRIRSRCVHTERYTCLRSYTGACNTESATGPLVTFRAFKQSTTRHLRSIADAEFTAAITELHNSKWHGNRG